MTTITETQKETLHIITEGFHGGRMNRAGNGYVSLEFEPYCKENENWHIVVTDQLNQKDGHYGPIDLNYYQLVELKEWIEKELAKVEVPE